MCETKLRVSLFVVPQVPEEVSHELLNETTLVLSWTEPERPNGDILDYQVNYFGYKTPAVVSPVQVIMSN